MRFQMSLNISEMMSPNGRVIINSRTTTTPTPYRNRRRSNSSRCFAPFKAPTPNKEHSKISRKEKLTLAKQVMSLNEKKDALDEQISDLRKLYSEEELDVHIKNLHEYNEIKDVGQMLLGRLAEVEQTTTRLLYARYSLEIDD